MQQMQRPDYRNPQSGYPQETQPPPAEFTYPGASQPATGDSAYFPGIPDQTVHSAASQAPYGAPAYAAEQHPQPAYGGQAAHPQSPYPAYGGGQTAGGNLAYGLNGSPNPYAPAPVAPPASQSGEDPYAPAGYSQEPPYGYGGHSADPPGFSQADPMAGYGNAPPSVVDQRYTTDAQFDRDARYGADPRAPPADGHDPRYAPDPQDPRYAGDPRYDGGDRAGGPHGDPRYSSPHPSDPRYADPRADPRYAEPGAPLDPRYADPRDPRYAPRHLHTGHATGPHADGRDSRDAYDSYHPYDPYHRPGPSHGYVDGPGRLPPDGARGPPPARDHDPYGRPARDYDPYDSRYNDPYRQGPPARASFDDYVPSRHAYRESSESYSDDPPPARSAPPPPSDACSAAIVDLPNWKNEKIVQFMNSSTNPADLERVSAEIACREAEGRWPDDPSERKASSGSHHRSSSSVRDPNTGKKYRAHRISSEPPFKTKYVVEGWLQPNVELEVVPSGLTLTVSKALGSSKEHYPLTNVRNFKADDKEGTFSFTTFTDGADVMRTLRFRSEEKRKPHDLKNLLQKHIDNLMVARSKPLPEFWEQRTAPDSRLYFVNHKTQETVWEDPRLKDIFD